MSDKYRMRVLVTGGAGFVGSVLVPQLLWQGYKVTVLDKFLFGAESLAGVAEHEDLQLISGDITDPRAVKWAMEDCDVVVHLAAIVGFPACKKDATMAQSVNVGGTNLLAELTPKNVPLFFASTGSVYGEMSEICREDVAPVPLTIYGSTKLDAEKILLGRGNAVIYRFATGYGLSPRIRLDLLVNDFVYRALKERNLVVYEKDFKRTFIHVGDMARSFLFGINMIRNKGLEEMSDRMAGQIFNVGSEEQNLTKEEIAVKIKEIAPFYLHFANTGQKDEDVRNYAVSYAKIRGVGYKTEVSMEVGIQSLIKFFRVFDIHRPYSNV
jgi:nucleoside-diphosphate-sugar epimerase